MIRVVPFPGTLGLRVSAFGASGLQGLGLLALRLGFWGRALALEGFRVSCFRVLGFRILGYKGLKASERLETF